MIKIGPAGLPNPESTLQEYAEKGFKACEVEFVYGVRMDREQALRIGKVAEKLGISLSVHAPFYINLASKERPKYHASIQRIMQSCLRASEMGASPVVFHAAFYQGIDKDKVYEIVKEAMLHIIDDLEKKDIPASILAPETTGKGSQFGDLDELLQLMKDTGCSICIDFAHLKARNNGKIDYKEIFEKIKELKKVHCHFSGINYGEKGERNHILTAEKDIKELLQWILKYKLDATIINESPDPVGDSAKSLKILKKV